MPALIRGADGLQFRLCRVWTPGASARWLLAKRGTKPRGIDTVRSIRSRAARRTGEPMSLQPAGAACGSLNSRAAGFPGSAANRGRAQQRAPRRQVPEGHGRTARRNRAVLLRHPYRVARRRRFGSPRQLRSRANAALRRGHPLPFQPQSGQVPVAPPLHGGRASTGRQEIGQCPTRCSSMRRIRRKPG